MSEPDIRIILAELGIIRTKLEHISQTTDRHKADTDHAHRRTQSDLDEIESRVREHSNRLNMADAHNQALAGLDPSASTTRHSALSPYRYRSSSVATITTAATFGGGGIALLLRWLVQVLVAG